MVHCDEGFQVEKEINIKIKVKKWKKKQLKIQKHRIPEYIYGEPGECTFYIEGVFYNDM